MTAIYNNFNKLPGYVPQFDQVSRKYGEDKVPSTAPKTEKLSAADVDIILRNKQERSADKGGVLSKPETPELTEPKSKLADASPEDEKKVSDAISQFGLRSADTLLLQVQMALRQMRASSAEMQGKMSILAEKAAHSTGDAILRQGNTAGAATMMQGVVNFGVTAAGVGMKNRAANRDIKSINDNLRPSNDLKKDIAVKTNAQQQAFNKPHKGALDSDAAAASATPDRGAVDASKLLAQNNLRPNARHSAVIEEPLHDMHAKTRTYDLDHNLGQLKNSQLGTKGDAMIAAGHTMGNMTRASGQMVESVEGMKQEYSRSANRALQESSSQAEESYKNDNNLVQAMQQQMNELARSRGETNRAIIGNMKA
jgi:hypothetical protein